MTSRLQTLSSLFTLSLAATMIVGCGDSDSDDTIDPGAQDSAVGDSAASEDGSMADSGVVADADVTSDSAADASITPSAFDLNLNGSVYSMLHAGKSWYLAGSFTAINTSPAPALLPLTAGGMPVAGCNLGKGFAGQVSSVLRVGGSIFVGGNFLQYNGQPASRIAKLDATTCALDTTFSPPGGQGFDSNVLALATAGTSLYVGGSFTAYRGVANSANRLAKLDLTTGAIDTTFSPVGPNANGFETNVYALATSGTSLYVGGTFNAYKGTYYNAMYLAKLDQTTGALDTTFSPNGADNNGFNSSVFALTVSGSSLYVGGTFTTYRGIPDSASRIAKLDLTSGARDTAFSPAGAGANGFNNVVYAMAASNTSLYVGGSFSAYRGVANSALGLAKLDLASGARDATFTPSGSDGFNAVTAVAMSGTDVIVGGAFERYKGAAYAHVAKLNGTSGVADPAFGSNGGTLHGVDRDVTAIAVDGTTIWLGGYFHNYGGNIANRIAKIDDVTYALDTTFSPAINGFDNDVYSIATSGTSLYVGGTFNGYRGVANSANRIAKLDLTSGALDGTFSPATNGFDDDVWVLTATSNAVFAGGGFGSYRGVAGSANHIAKLDAASGALDTTFSPATNGFDDWVYALAVSGTSLYVGGEFSAYRGATNAFGLAKLDIASGALDTTFSPAGVGNNGVDGVVLSLAVNGDALFVGGEFSAYRGVPNSALNLAKLNATTGAIDTTFTMPGANGGFDDDVRTLAVSGTSLFVGGSFVSYRGVLNAANYMAKLDTTSGAIDTTFSPLGATANGFDNNVYVLAPYEGSLFLGGDFKAYRGTTSVLYGAKIDAVTGTKQ